MLSLRLWHERSLLRDHYWESLMRNLSLCCHLIIVQYMINNFMMISRDDISWWYLVMISLWLTIERIISDANSLMSSSHVNHQRYISERIISDVGHVKSNRWELTNDMSVMRELSLWWLTWDSWTWKLSHWCQSWEITTECQRWESHLLCCHLSNVTTER